MHISLPHPSVPIYTSVKLTSACNTQAPKDLFCKTNVLVPITHRVSQYWRFFCTMWIMRPKAVLARQADSEVVVRVLIIITLVFRFPRTSSSIDIHIPHLTSSPSLFLLLSVIQRCLDREYSIHFYPRCLLHQKQRCYIPVPPSIY